MLSIIPFQDYNDAFRVFANLSADSKADMDAFGWQVPELVLKAEDSPSSFVICFDGEPECILWLDYAEGGAATSMYYSKGFLGFKGGITTAVKSLLENEIKDKKVGFIECHSTLNNPSSEKWYQSLGFTKTDRGYTSNSGVPIAVFELVTERRG